MSHAQSLIQPIVRWYDDSRTILLCEVSPQWTWRDAHQVMQWINAQSTRANHPIQTIIHFLTDDSAVLPPGRAIPALRQLILMNSPKNELTVIVGANTLLHQLFTITSQVYRLRPSYVAQYHFVESLDAAVALIKDHRRLKCRAANIRGNHPDVSP